MCLESVKKNYKNVKERDFGIGYKRLVQDSDGIHFRSPINGKGVNYVAGKWYQADGDSIDATNGEEYKAGFHIFLSKKDAEEYTYATAPVVRVRYRDVVAFGPNKIRIRGQEVGDCVISREMMIEKDQ